MQWQQWSASLTQLSTFLVFFLSYSLFELLVLFPYPCFRCYFLVHTRRRTLSSFGNTGLHVACPSNLEGATPDGAWLDGAVYEPTRVQIVRLLLERLKLKREQALQAQQERREDSGPIVATSLKSATSVASTSSSSGSHPGWCHSRICLILAVTSTWEWILVPSLGGLL